MLLPRRSLHCLRPDTRTALLSLLALAASSDAVTLANTGRRPATVNVPEILRPWVGPSNLPYECQQPHEDYLERPIKDVLYLNPGIDGWCYYGWLGNFFSACSIAHQKKSYAYYLDNTINMTGNGVNVWSSDGEPWKIFVGGKTILGKDRNHPLYDTLCAVNGYYYLPRKLVHDWRGMNELSENHCRLMSQKYPEFFNMSMYDFFNEINEVEEKLAPITRNSNFAVTALGNVDGLMASMFKLEAMQCLLGGVGCDMAMCIARGCMRKIKHKGHQILYGPECPVP